MGCCLKFALPPPHGGRGGGRTLLMALAPDLLWLGVWNMWTYHLLPTHIVVAVALTVAPGLGPELLPFVPCLEWVWSQSSCGVGKGSSFSSDSVPKLTPQFIGAAAADFLTACTEFKTRSFFLKLFHNLRFQVKLGVRF